MIDVEEGYSVTELRERVFSEKSRGRGHSVSRVGIDRMFIGCDRRKEGLELTTPMADAVVPVRECGVGGGRVCVQ